MPLIHLQVPSRTAKYNFRLCCLSLSHSRSHPSLLALPELILPLSARTTFDHSPLLTSLLTNHRTALLCAYSAMLARPPSLTSAHICALFALLTLLSLHLASAHVDSFYPLFPIITLPCPPSLSQPRPIIIPDSAPLTSDRPGTSLFFDNDEDWRSAGEMKREA
jgi:hypothetical protein